MKRVASIVLTATLSVSAVAISVAWLYRPKPSCHGHMAAQPPVAVQPVQQVEPTQAITAQDLKGLWSRYPDSGRDDADPVAFYYFHDGGIGLYRYGRIGFNTTNSYTWAVGEHQGQPILGLRYKKTGEVQHLRISVDADGRKTLTIEADPKQPGEKASRYVYVPPPSQSPTTMMSMQLGDLLPPQASPAAYTSLSGTVDAVSAGTAVIDDRLWIDQKRFATGGIGFQLYQLRKAGIDGRGTGWFHVGDYDDWSTESFSFRIRRATAEGQKNALDLRFGLRDETSSTGFVVDTSGPHRLLGLVSDPRDFWAPHTFVDAGPSFAALLARNW
jgi:hypothetical protein